MSIKFQGRPLWGVLLLFMAAQIWFSVGFRGLRPTIDVMPPAPSEVALKAMALGDDEFVYRYWARWMEFVGDGGGRWRPLRDYDYDRVVDWLEALDRFDDNRSDLTHAVAAQYFGEITKAADPSGARIRKIIDYLRRVALRDPVRFWSWLVWDADKARADLKSADLIESLARDLQSPELRDKSVPAWVRLLPIQLYRSAGDTAAANRALAEASPTDIAEVEAMQQQLRDRILAAKKRMNGEPSGENAH